MIDERTRHEMYLGLVEKLGPPVADAVMQHLPPVGWADVATKHDLAALEQRLDLRFRLVDARFDALLGAVDSRFGAVDARFGQLDSRFEQVDARFGQLDSRFEQIDARFGQLDSRFEQIDARFTQLDSRFETLLELMDHRFENVLDSMNRGSSESDVRMDALGSDLRAEFAVGQRHMIQWMVATVIAIMAVATAIASAAIQLG